MGGNDANTAFMYDTPLYITYYLYIFNNIFKTLNTFYILYIKEENKYLQMGKNLIARNTLTSYRNYLNKI